MSPWLAPSRCCLYVLLTRHGSATEGAAARPVDGGGGTERPPTWEAQSPDWSANPPGRPRASGAAQRDRSGTACLGFPAIGDPGWLGNKELKGGWRDGVSCTRVCTCEGPEGTGQLCRPQESMLSWWQSKGPAGTGRASRPSLESRPRAVPSTAPCRKPSPPPTPLPRESRGGASCRLHLLPSLPHTSQKAMAPKRRCSQRPS